MEKYNHNEISDPFNNRKMLNNSVALFEAVEQAEQLTKTLQDIASRSGYECLAFIDYAPVSTTNYQQHVYGQYDADIEGYLDNDEIYRYCKSGIRITSLEKLLAQRGEIEQLYVLPLKGVPGIVGALVFNIPKNFIEFQSIELIDWYWTILSPYLLNAAIRCRSSHFNITSREKDCLLWASEGKTSWEISQILGISERTVNFHLTNCIEKTQSANRQQAIVKCLINNII
ncbi:helix-turn-helix transcriptional regulator [Pseudoalteromonas viridis]|uniref:Helix-turn-helix transcriptional regulator n=1 Tax=Pseudoalteromonas viridis TaxID=339617 RepID=A0ABX7V9L9_9GAMM|nr:helix-turn-helix transcriptional regulator [Pseudoalteromonas viridis]QTL36466.1 helix-turn-helix transcriptional regulator [Pseudoalteromonas viridis]